MEENIYRKSRKKAARTKPLLNNCESAQDLVYIERTKLLSIESGDKIPSPDDVVSMSKVYDAPELCNYYCTHECAIGEKTVEEIEIKSLSQIAIETLNSLNKMTRLKDRLLEIVEDGRVRPDESDDFLIIKSTLDKIAASVNALQLWVDGQIADGKLDRKMFSR